MRGCWKRAARTVKVMRWLGVSIALGGALWAQGIGLDQISAGPVDLHDHIRFNFHIPIENDPYPHQFIQDYAFDGVDLMAHIDWHWQNAHFQTGIRVTPEPRNHFAFDQDTDFEPNTDFTHGDSAIARSRTFGIDQLFPEWGIGRWGHVAFSTGLLRQFTHFGYGTTYNLNSNPALPSSSYTNVIGETAIVYQINTTAALIEQQTHGSWRLGSATAVTPLSSVLLHNYIPERVSTEALAYGGTETLNASRRVDGWELRIIGSAGRTIGYRVIEGFWRETFAAGVELGPPAGKWF